MLTLKHLKRLHLGFTVPPGPEAMLDWFEALHASYIRNGEPTSPHVVLPDGRHATAAFNCEALLCHGNLRELAATALVIKLRQSGLSNIDGVFGSPRSTTLAADLGRLLWVPNYVVETAVGGGMVFRGGDLVPVGSVLLGVEASVRTLEVAATAAGAILCGAPNKVSFHPKVATIVYYPESLRTPAHENVMAIVEKEVAVWAEVDCPLCTQGSQAIPLDGKDKAKLFAK
jgi:hypothetical protein